MYRVLFIIRDSAKKIPGGDYIQAINTSKELKKIDCKVDIKFCSDLINYSNYDLIHFFNLMRPDDILQHTNKTNLKFIISTIFIDFSQIDFNEKNLIKRIVLNYLPFNNEWIKRIIKWLINQEKIPTKYYLLFGHKKSINKCIENASLLLPNSENEKQRVLKQFPYIPLNKFRIIPNGINLIEFDINSIKKENIILCVGRIESRKNQLNVIKAFNQKNFKLIFIGNVSNNQKKYFDLCKKYAKNKNIEFINYQLTEQELIKYFKIAKVHILASWFETTGLVSLEAVYFGCNIIITDKGDTKDYFGNYAYYCNPSDVNSINNAIKKSLKVPFNNQFRNEIIQKYTWEKAANETLKAYKLILNKL